MPRIPPVTGKADLAPEHQAVADAVIEVFGSIRGPFSMLLHSPVLAAHVLELVKFYRADSVVEAPLRSLAILATARERKARYVWAAQVAAARRAGVSEAVIDLLRAEGDPAALPADQRDIIDYARQLMRTNRVEPALFERLKAKFGAKWLVELTAAANYFAFLSGVVNAFEVDPPADGDKLPA